MNRFSDSSRFQFDQFHSSHFYSRNGGSSETFEFGLQLALSDGILIGADTFTASLGAPNGIATLDGSGRVPASQLTLDAMEFKGNWSAVTNSPTLVDGTGNAGDMYRISAAGTQDLGSGPQSFVIGDVITYSGSVWQKSPGQDALVASSTRLATPSTLLKRDSSGSAAIAVMDFGSVTLANFPTGGSIGTAAATVDVASAVQIPQTTAAQVLTLPSPTSSALVRRLYVANTGTAAFTMLGQSVGPNTVISALWTGSAWLPVPQGPEGIQGPQGIQGPEGIQGPQGISGYSGLFVSSEQTGTGSAQSIPHGLGTTPTKVMVSTTDTTIGAGIYAVTEGVHDATNVVITLTSSVKYKVLASL